MPRRQKTSRQDRHQVGQKQRKRRRRGVSEYGRMLREKQELKAMYNLRERQFRRYVREVLAQGEHSEDIADLLIRRLETRLDNVIYRLGIAETRPQARQLVAHGHFAVNGRRVDIPSFQVQQGDVITTKESSKSKGVFKDADKRLKKYQPPSWLEFDKKKKAGSVVGAPSLGEVQPPVEVPLIFEFYAR